MLGDLRLPKALGAAIPTVTVEDAIVANVARERQQRFSPTHLVVALMVALGLWA